MKIATILFASLTLISATFVDARADTCSTKTSCTKKIKCPTGYGLVLVSTTEFACSKSTTAAETGTPQCADGTLKQVDGQDYCEQQVSVKPTCKNPHKFENGWKWDVGAKQCERIKDNGKPVYDTDNLQCPAGTSYKASNGKCEGTKKDYFTATDIGWVCDAVLAGSVLVWDFSGNKDMCVKQNESVQWAAPLL